MSVTISGSVRLQMKLSDDWESRHKYVREYERVKFAKVAERKQFLFNSRTSKPFDREIAMEENMCGLSLWT